MRIIRIRDFVKQDENIPWLVEGLLPAVGWTLLVGRKGVGKTTFAIQLCAALQQGEEFLGRKTVQTNIVFLQADSVPIEWKFILKRVDRVGLGWTLIDVPSKALGNDSYVRGIKNLVEKVQPGFIVFDSLYKLSKENINTEAVLRTIDSLNDIASEVPWLLIHHPPHGEIRASGHNSLGGNCSNEWHLHKNKLVLEKGRLVAGGEILLSRDTEGMWSSRETPQQSTYADMLLEKALE